MAKGQLTLKTLAAAYTTATGCTEDRAAEVLAGISAYWRLLPEKLPAFVVSLTAPGVEPFHVLLWLLVTSNLDELPQGRAVIMHAAVRIAERDGISLLDGAWTTHSPNERGH
jgi:hypothetical protein